GKLHAGQQRGKPRRDGGATYCPDSPSHNSANKSTDDKSTRSENRHTQAPPRRPQGVQARAGAAGDALAYDKKHRRQDQRICWSPDRAQQPISEPAGQRHQQHDPPNERPCSESTADQQAEQRQVPWRAAQNSGSLRYGDQGHPKEEDRYRAHQRGGGRHVAHSGQAQNETDAVATQLGRGTAGGALGEVAGPEITMPRQPFRYARKTRDNPGLQRPNGSGDSSRRAPRDDAPEHGRMTDQPKQQQGRKKCRRPDYVVQECLAAAPESEERISPAVLEQQSWPRQAKREECVPGCASEHRGRCEHTGTGGQTHNRGSPGTARDRTSPRRQICTTKPDHQRIGAEAS